MSKMINKFNKQLILTIWHQKILLKLSIIYLIIKMK